MSDLVPAGRYSATVRACALTEIESSHEERFKVEFAIVASPTDDPSVDGALVQASYGFSTDKATNFTFGQLRALGWKGADLSNVALDLESVFSITVKHNTNPNSGKTYAEATVNVGGVERYALDANRAKAFAAKMAAKVKAFDAASGSGKPTPATNGQRPAARASAPAARQWDGTGPDPNDDGRGDDLNY